MAHDNWGSAARFGIFIVGNEAVPEAEWWAMAPPGVSVHAARVTASTPWATQGGPNEKMQLAPDVERGAAQFASMALSAAVLAHSSSSVLGGPGWDDAVSAELRQRLHPSTKVSTNGVDCLRALKACGIERPFLVYPPWFNDAFLGTGEAYFSNAGFRPAASFRNVPEPQWADVPPQDLYKRFMHLDQNIGLLFEQITANCPVEADGVLIIGTGMRCVALIDQLEAKLARPVVTANQASLWRCLSLVGIHAPVMGFGSLLAGQRPIN